MPLSFKFINLFFLLSLFGCAANSRVLPNFSLDDSHQQVLLVVPVARHAHIAKLTAWQLNQRVWSRVFQCSAVIGKNGLAIINQKKEGDGSTPSGEFLIHRAFGYSPSAITGLDYQPVTDDDYWVDDQESSLYNQWVRGKVSAKSFERLKRTDQLYSLAAIIEYNTSPVVPGKGSAIFLHVWRSYSSPTAGCVAVSSRNMRKTLAWLDKEKKPIIILRQ